MAQPNGAEVLMWALINRARLDPAGEAVEHGLSSINEGNPMPRTQGAVFVPLTTTSKQALAWNEALFNVADQHSQDMMNAQQLFHNTAQQHGDNLNAAGYQFNRWAENASQSSGLPANLTDAARETAVYDQHRSLFVDTSDATRWHRYNILQEQLQEVGVGEVIGNFNGVSRSIMTHDFATPSSGGQFLTGIAYNDTSGNAFYSVGEGRGGIVVNTSAGAVTTGTAGAYSKALAAGVQTVTFSGGDLASPVTVNVTLTAGRNALVDLVGQSTVETSASLTAVTNNVLKIVGLGNIGLSLTGNGQDNTIVSALGNDVIDGAGGFDTAVYSGNRASYTITTNANGTVTVSGMGATDTLSSIEKVQFDDQAVVLVAQATAGTVSIDNVTVTEGNAGTKLATFTVTRTGGTAAFSVDVATQAGTASSAAGDYVGKSATLNFGAGVNTQTFAVTINGDTTVEPTETFNAVLSNATGGATISKATGVGTITNDDVAPAVTGSISIDNITVTEGNAGTKLATFTVTRTGGTAAFSVDAATQAGTASGAAGDYVAKGATLNFGVGVNTQTFAVTINGDTTVEPTETFNVALSNATNGATISKATGVGTITNDDTTATPVNHAPEVTTFDKSVVMNGSMAGSSLFSARDADGDTITKYAFWDGGSNGGHFSVNGVEQGSGKWTIVNASDVGSVRYVGGENAGQELLFVSVFDGKVWSEVEGLTATTTPRQSPMDYNGDGRSDILWQHSNGAITEWLMNSSSSFNQTGLIGGGGDPSWRVVSGRNDFNGDGKGDLLWQHKNGAVTLWMMNGDDYLQTGLIGGDGNPDWQIKGAGDFNGDGKADIVWQHTGGGVAMWLGNGDGNFTGSDIIGVTGDTNWQIEAVGDINGDGKDDVLWQRADNGAVAAWMMDGTDIKSSVALGGGGDPNWDVRASGDFNGDGKDDILWQHSNGAVAIWQMDGANATSSDLIGGNGHPDWEVKGTGDFNADGRADVIFQQLTTGAVFIWEMNGFDFSPSGLLGGGGDPNWQVIGV